MFEDQQRPAQNIFLWSYLSICQTIFTFARDNNILTSQLLAQYLSSTRFWLEAKDLNDSEIELPEAEIFCFDDHCVRYELWTDKMTGCCNEIFSYLRTEIFSCSDAGTNSTALSSGANSPQLQRYVLQAPVKTPRKHPETIASPQYQVEISNNFL